MNQSDQLTGCVALITGGGGEIGGAIARRFAQAGAAIAIADIRREAAEAVATEITSAQGQAIAVRTNVAVAEDAERAVRHAAEAFGKLTTLVNVAAAVTPDGTVETLTLDDWNEALAVNLTGVFLMCKYAVPEIRKAGGGTIINIASQLGQIGIAGRSPYSASKAALIAFTEALAVEVKEHGVRVNCVSPGAVDTPMWKEAGGGAPADMSPEEVAETILFLASERSRPINGQNLHVYSA
jgi:NAD(P)-dependent dehydrogenase (short-subunit alcohol dehydrogenase family)